MTFEQHYLSPVPGLRFWWHPNGVVEWPPGRVLGVSVSWENSCSREIGGKSAGRSWWSPIWRFRSETKIGPRVAYPRGLRLGRDPVVVIGIVAPFTPPGGSVFRQNNYSRDPGGVNAFVCVDNGFPAALPLASPRLKIQMAPHCCCRETPRAGYSGRQCGKSLVLEKFGVKVQGVLVKSKMKI